MLVNQHCLTVLWGYFSQPLACCFLLYYCVFVPCFDHILFPQGNRAIVVDEPGVTRDRLYGRSVWGDHEFMVIDTGGVMTLSKSQEDVVEDMNVSTTIGMEGIPLAARESAVAKMPSQIERQAAIAIEESSVIIFVVDGQVCSVLFSPVLLTCL